ncbi:MAG: deoxyribodipyrimidine photo-lyase [Halieaceae bacterium]|nr:deoxyribodipyrimidine photo-lyase [Halieaceae bacterium]
MTDSLIYWFRQDLRLTDLPGLQAAIGSGHPVIPVYIHDPDAADRWAPGGASRWWLHHSLAALGSDIEALGGRLHIYSGPTTEILQQLVAATGAGAVYCSRGYEPWSAALERAVHDKLAGDGCDMKRFPGSLLFEPEQIANQSGLPFKVFTPFWKACRRQPTPAVPKPAPEPGAFFSGELAAPTSAEALGLEALGLLPTQPNWAAGWEALWQPGEAGAASRLETFLASGIEDYSDGRDRPALEVTSRLSPHIHFGEVSPRQVWHAATAGGHSETQVSKFLSELGWREFSYHLLHHFPSIPEQAFKAQFADFPWLGNPEHLKAWQRGQTGYPIVDAGMRQLWQTGYMHNRVRMIVASFLTKHLLLPWQAGEDWFWDTLVDADLASNACSWQWVAGSGADAAPYFRIFNPTAQGEKFDGQGEYVRHWVPEVAGLPDKYLHAPWTAPDEVLSTAGITLGVDYPQPLVDHKQARQAALDAYGEIRQAS